MRSIWPNLGLDEMSVSLLARVANAELVEALKELDDDAREDLFAQLAAAFCLHCGSCNPGCNCTNDE